ncbi:CocE/NonD family hydrolase [Tropicibacter sp. R16_0]|uniref:CocE/NonD family hydrolase n=1 Tax=Tropicibacter sp. R16_0 TaxID=2821102 RepID=UPI001ADA6D61|nr:CocE/NonD family hydrolase [Tropicibacter sp. R16_0]MBO9449228.1 CocE/NonD family hydrolase [Tropicibacter sp. R16_0]
MTSPNTLLDIEELPDVGITLSDGCRLSARIWRPKNAGTAPVPAILEYLPYRKRDGTCARDALTHPYMAKRGYACIRVDIRGNGDSQGLMEDEYTQQELDDAVEVIHWLAAQDWCSGSVGMMGISWGGFNALQVAALQPDPLKAVVSLCSTADRYADDIHYKGGCLLNENLGWGATMWSFSSRAPDPALVGDAWREMWMERLENEPFLPTVWLRHQTRDTYWQHGSICEDFSAIRTPVLTFSGWGDSYMNTVPLLVENLSVPTKGINGPWIHKYPHFAIPGPRIGFLQEALRWWDRWLKGIENGAEDDPDYRAYVMDGVAPERRSEHREGRWIVETEGATSHLPTETWHLSNHGLGPEGPLDRQINTPLHCGMECGEYGSFWAGPELPGDQRMDDALSCCCDSDPLEADLDIVGAPRIRLSLTSDKQQAQIAVRLNHVLPDGTSSRITYGVLNLTHRDSHSDPTPLKPGESYDITLDLDHIAYRVPKGHRLRVAVSTSYWPMIWPSPERPTLALTQGQIDLPMRPAGSNDEWTFPPADADEPWKITVLKDSSNTRRTEIDHATGEVRLIIEDDNGRTIDDDHGLMTASVARETWVIHPDDPLSARGTCHWTDEMGRGDWNIRTETHCEMWADHADFHLKASLFAYENDTLVYKRDLSDKIPRTEM